MNDLDTTVKYFGLKPQPKRVWPRFKKQLEAWPDTYRPRVYNEDDHGQPMVTGEDGVDKAFAVTAVQAFDSSVEDWPGQVPPYALVVTLGGLVVPAAATEGEMDPLGTQTRAQQSVSLLWFQAMLQLALARELLDLTFFDWRGRGYNPNGGNPT